MSIGLYALLARVLAVLDSEKGMFQQVGPI